MWSKERAKLPINGKMKLSEGVISLELIMKCTELRLNLDYRDIEKIKNTYDKKYTEIRQNSEDNDRKQ